MKEKTINNKQVTTLVRKQWSNLILET
jgi:hypothetical protein